MRRKRCQNPTLNSAGRRCAWLNGLDLSQNEGVNIYMTRKRCRNPTLNAAGRRCARLNGMDLSQNEEVNL